MVDPITTAALVKGGATIASSLIPSLFGGKKKKPLTAEDQAHIQGELQKDQWHVNMAMSKKYGIHPLAALGISPTSSGVIPQSSYDTGDISGQNLARAAGAAIKGFKAGALEKLALERAELQNDLLRAELTQMTNVGSQPGDPQIVVNPDEKIHVSKSDPGLTAASDKEKNPSPAGKRLTVGETPYGKVYITLPPSGQADEYGELYGAVKGLEYLTKRGYVHYANGTYKAGKALRKKIKSIFRKAK